MCGLWCFAFGCLVCVLFVCWKDWMNEASKFKSNSFDDITSRIWGSLPGSCEKGLEGMSRVCLSLWVYDARLQNYLFLL